MGPGAGRGRRPSRGICGASGGQIWDDPKERRTYLEVGGELWITVEALGGLWAANFVVGLAYPLLPEGPTLLYFGLGR